MKKLIRQKGVATIEFAIILPLLIILVFGIIEFSLLLYDKQVITNASREGARKGIVFRHPARVTNAEITEVVNAYCSNYLITFGSPAAPVTTITRTGMNSGDELTVAVSYTYNFLIIPKFITSLTGTKTINAVTVMRME
ncbi:MAG: TadE family protein [Candidatus Loosdrechtia sp.]|uniref:TadE family protein n=1 Tax=Candidatus Loosdrechtia sp. TaxID=3101272 RepID=UPI003A639E2E|nr:MAG: TadE/TadG family type IV pilus assembly protein [Candidatus Jettenia sp. AMX2]